jgi:Na+-driven multidrug efflux pump
MFLTLFSLWIIRIPAAVFLSRETVYFLGLTFRGAGLGEAGIWWSIPAGWTVGMILSFIYYKTGRWKRKGVVKAEVSQPTATR